MPESKPKPAKVPEDAESDVYYSVKYIRESFALFKEQDTDNNHFISFNELKAAVKKRNPKATDKEIQEVFKILDLDDNKKISFDEYLSFDFALDAHVYNYGYAIVI